MPILDYASGAWSLGENFPQLDKTQYRATRFFCGLPRTTSIPCLIGEMGWAPGVVRRDIETLRLYNQIVKMPQTRITRLVFESDLDQNGQWSKNLKGILHSINKLNYLESRSVVNLVDAKKV